MKANLVKSKTIVLGTLLICNISFSQALRQSAVPLSTVNTTTQTGVVNKRISILVGIGPTILTKKLFFEPVIDPLNNNVEIQRSTILKANISLGISYTPFTTDIISTVRTVAPNGTILTTQGVESVQKGPTFSLFVNPVLLTKLTESQNFFDSPDFGVGYGHRFAGGLSILVTGEFFSVRQPRDWFIAKFKQNGSQLILDNQVQKTIDAKDNSIFVSKPVICFGLKFCYNLDIIKNFTNSTITTSSN